MPHIHVVSMSAYSGQYSAACAQGITRHLMKNKYESITVPVKISQAVMAESLKPNNLPGSMKSVIKGRNPSRYQENKF